MQIIAGMIVINFGMYSNIQWVSFLTNDYQISDILVKVPTSGMTLNINHHCCFEKFIVNSRSLI